MRQRLVSWFSAVIVALAVVAYVSPRANAADPAPLLIIANPNFPANDISLADIKSAFQSRRVEIGGLRVIPVNHQVRSPLRVRFDSLVLGLAAHEVGKYWIDRRIRDDGSPPTAVPTAETAVRVVAALAGAITYGTPDQLNVSVKVLTIDGKSADDVDYPLGNQP